MIHHISMAADHPLHVAKVIAEIWNGQIAPFAICPRSYIVLKRDKYGTAIEILPSGVEITLKRQRVAYENNPSHSKFSSTRVIISASKSLLEIEKIAKRESWYSTIVNHNQSKAIEFWIENKFLLEIISDSEKSGL